MTPGRCVRNTPRRTLLLSLPRPPKYTAAHTTASRKTTHEGRLSSPASYSEHSGGDQVARCIVSFVRRGGAHVRRTAHTAPLRHHSRQAGDGGGVVLDTGPRDRRGMA